MTILDLVIAPNPIFKESAEFIEKIDNKIVQLGDDMLETMYHHNAVGIGANMLGLLKRIIVVDISENKDSPLIMFNPKVKITSVEMQEFEEGSLCYPGISAKIKRPKYIKVDYIDKNNKLHTLKAEGWLAQVIQHEADYLDGVIYLDYISKLKQDMLLKKMEKFKKQMA